MSRRRTTLLGAAAAALTLLAAGPAYSATAPGQVFSPSPVADLGIQTLTDQKDADYFSASPTLAKAYHRVTLTDLDASGTLTGSYARVESETGTPARITPSGFIYTRDQDQFEQVMGYHWITQAQRYIQSLGFRNVNHRQQLLRINQYGGDNSFYRNGKSKLTITLGKGGVDDAEDADVIVHEYGHSVQDDQVPNFGSSPDAGAIGEGFGDYLAVTVTQPVTPQSLWPCVADWDSTSYTRTTPHCLRRTDGTKQYPADLVGEVHADGEIWSAALYEMNTGLGRDRATKITIGAQFGFTPTISMPAAAQVTVDYARKTDPKAVPAAKAAFAAHGLSTT